MKYRRWIVSVPLMLAILACNLPVAAITPTPALVTSTPGLPTASPLPSPTSPALATATPTVPVATPLDQPVNCRLGAGIEWEAISALLLGQTATIIGRSNTSSWWLIHPPNEPTLQCWVNTTVVRTAGNLANLPVVLNPAASVTDLGISVDPQDISLPGCFGPVAPIEITGSITVNGPLTVEYRFETQQGGAMAPQELEFDGYGTQTVEIDYSPPPAEGEFWVRLVILDPDSDPDSAQTTYEIDCP